MKQCERLIRELMIYCKTELNKRKQDITKNQKFSGVDYELGEVYKYLDFIGRNKVDVGYNITKSMPFDNFKEFIKNQAKAIQINSSKQIGNFKKFIVFSFLNDQRRTKKGFSRNSR